MVLLILAASLSGLELQAGRPFTLSEAAPAGTAGTAGWGWGETIVLVLRGVLALALVLLPLYIVLNLLTPEGRKRLGTDLMALLIIAGTANLLGRYAEPAVVNEAEQGALGQAPAATPAAPTDVFTAQAPPWAELLILAAVAALVATLVTAAVWWVRKRRQAAQPGAFERLAQQAQQTLDALSAGEALQDAVKRSYRQMILFLQEERGIHRERDLTPSEFEQQLAQAGFPPQPVHGLTGLFERVRYGHLAPGPADEELAVRSLQQIVDFCQSQESRP